MRQHGCCPDTIINKENKFSKKEKDEGKEKEKKKEAKCYPTSKFVLDHQGQYQTYHHPPKHAEAWEQFHQ